MAEIKNKVLIVGAGPGDPELLTIKALKAIKGAQIILHDGLFGEEILSFCHSECEKIYVGKKCGDHQNQTDRQNWINDLMLQYYGEGKKVVRLKTGDPLIFGRGIEEIRFLKNHQVPYELVPGVTAGMAAANLCVVPVTERSRNSAVLLCTGHTMDENNAHSAALTEILKGGTPLVVYMGLQNLEALIERFIGAGVPKTTKVTVASRVSFEDMDMVSGDFTNIIGLLHEHPLETPCVIFIGENVATLK